MLQSLVLSTLHWLTRRVLSPPRVIFDRNGEYPYLSRWYLIGERSSDKPGDKPKKRLFPHLYLHKFHMSDDSNELHSHPFSWAWVLILWGGYVEEYRVGDRTKTRAWLPGSLRLIRPEDYHRVVLLEKESWSLMLTGSKSTTWYFWCRNRLARAEWYLYTAWRRGVTIWPSWEPDTREPEVALPGGMWRSKSRAEAAIQQRLNAEFKNAIAGVKAVEEKRAS